MRWDRSKPPRGPFVLNKDCPQAQGLVAWYPFGIAGGNFVADQSNNNNPLTATNGPTLTRGRAGEIAGKFVAASSQYMSRASVPMSGYPFTMMVNVLLNNVTANQDFFNLNVSGSTTEIFRFLQVASGSLVFSKRIASVENQFAFTASPAANTWYNCIGECADTNTIQPYLNGVAGTGSAAVAGAFASFNMLALGILGANLGNPLDGQLSEASVWNVAIGQTIATRLNDPAYRFEMYYPLRSRKWMSLTAAAPSAGKPWLFYTHHVAGIGA